MIPPPLTVYSTPGGLLVVDELILGAEGVSACSFEEVVRGSSTGNQQRRYVRGICFVESDVQRSCQLYLRNIRSLWKSSLRSGLSITAETHP